jgi:HK97 family phage major capsid protein
MADNNGIAEQITGLSTDISKLTGTITKAKDIAEAASTKQAEMAAQLKELNDETKVNQDWRKEAEEKSKQNQDALNSLIVDVKTMREGGVPMLQGPGNDFASALAKGLHQNQQKLIESMGSGASYKFALAKGTGLHTTKAASNMILPTNLTGDAVFSYIPIPFLTPRQLVNFRDLVPGIQTATGNIVIYRENYNGGVSPESGAFGQQTTQGSLKEQVGYNFTNVPFTAYYISGFVRIAKQMLQDLPFLQTYLPGMLLRDYYKKENAVFYAAQIAAALGTPGGAGANDAETIINGITSLEGANFAVNGIVTTPAEWGTLIKTTFTTTPIGVVYNQASGQMEIAGVPILKATWVATDKALIGDFTQSQVATVDGLRVEFFEQDSDNVERNLITVRVECRCVLITGQPYAFIEQSV